ncbi:MAG: alginate O-acetyltransferase, partial [Panacagrimonas sp.]
MTSILRKLPGGYRRLAFAALAALLPPALLAPGVAAAVQFPQFDAVPCCQLCPRAADPANYTTKYLSSYRTLVQGRDGWLFRTEADLLMEFGPKPEGLRRLAELRDEFKKRGIEVVIMVQPPRGLMHADKLRGLAPNYDPDVQRANYVRLLETLRATGFTVPPLDKLVEAEGTEDYFWRTDHHWTPAGTRLTAKLVAETIKRMPEFKDVKRQRFVTRREGLLARGGTMGTAASQLCGYQTPKQYVPRFVTEADGGGGDGDGGAASLLGDESVPQITLIGTSNSEPTYNFSGFLSEALEADILNVSIVGGGVEGSLLAYISSEEFRSSPPRILVWEMEHYHELDDPMIYRQAMPLFDDGCNGKTVILEREVMLKQGNNEVLFNGGGMVRPIKGRDYVFDLQFSDPATNELRGQVWYTTGTKDKLRIEHARRGPSRKGRFIAEMRSDEEWGEQTFMGLDVELQPPEVAVAPPPPPAIGAAPPPPPPAPAKVAPQKLRARLCSMSQRVNSASTS